MIIPQSVARAKWGEHYSQQLRGTAKGLAKWGEHYAHILTHLLLISPQPTIPTTLCSSKIV